MKRERVQYIDIIRVFACICILVVHFNAQVSGYSYYGTFYYPNSLTPNWYLGAYLGDIGVSLFFMISGASLMLSNESTPLKVFYRKRFFNIYPAYWIAFCVASLLSFFVFRRIPTGKPYYLVFSILGLDGYLGSLGFPFGSFYQVGEWFLGCIILLYLVWPLLREGIKRAPVTTWVVSLAVCLFFSTKSGIWFFVRFPELLFGMSVVKFQWNKRPILLTLSTFSSALVGYLLYQKGLVWNFLWTVAFCAFLFAVLLVISQCIKSKRVQTLLTKFSGLTYPLFLVHHWIIIKLVSFFDLSNFTYRNTVLLFVLYILLIVPTAFVLKKLGDRFTRILKGKAPDSAASSANSVKTN